MDGSQGTYPSRTLGIQMRTGATHYLASALAALLTLPSTAAGQQEPVGRSGQPVFRTAVELVEVTVSVTDAEGRRVDDLTADAFEVVEDGQVQPILSFSHVVVPAERFDGPVSYPAPDVASNELRADGGRTYLLLLDDVHTPPLRSDTVQAMVRHFVEFNLRANDLVAISTTSGLPPSQHFTSDRRRLLEAADQFIGRDVVDSFPTLFSPADAISIVDPLLQEKAMKARQLMRVLTTSAEWMAGTDTRRRSIILLGQGVDYDTYKSTLEDPLAAPLSVVMAQTAKVVARHDVTLYAMDPRGLDTPGLFSDAAWRAKNVLQNLAEESGGFAIVNSDRFGEAFERIVAENSAYYLLGYAAPRDAPDNRRHQIRVRVARPGVTVRARKSYVHSRVPAAPPDDDIAGQMAALLDSPLPQPGMVLDLATLPLRGDDGATEVVVIVEVRPPGVPVDGRGSLADNLVLELIAVDTDGNVLGRRQVEVSVPTDMREASDERGVRALARLTLPESELVHLRAAVINRVTGARGSVHYQLEVPDLRSGVLALSGVAMGVLGAPSMPTALPEPGFQTAVPVPPSARRVFTSDDTLVVFAEIYRNGSGPGRYLDLTCKVRNDWGETVFSAEEERLVHFGTTSYQMTVPLQGLGPGAYVLTIEADAADGDANEKLRPVARHVPFTVR